MSDVRDPATDQQLPLPRRDDLPYCHDLAVDLLYERKAFGTRKYGTPLQPCNGRSFHLDAVQEAADLLAYLVGQQWQNDNPESTWLGQLCWALMHRQDWRDVEMPQQVRVMLETFELGIAP